MVKLKRGKDMSNRIKRPDAQVAMMNFIGRENNFIHFQYEKEMLQYQMLKKSNKKGSHKPVMTSIGISICNYKFAITCMPVKGFSAAS